MDMTTDQTKVLITNDEREQALAQLREAYIDGQLTLEEFSDRVETVLTARTQTDLVPAVSDIVTVRAAPRSLGRPPERIVAVMGDAKRKGRWRIGPETTAIAVAGDCELDLRNAEVSGAEVEITAYAIMGEVKVIVPEGVDVELTGVAVMGDKKYKVSDAKPLPGAPLIRVKAYAVMGDVKVQSKR
jgi:hypothetical protein